MQASLSIALVLLAAAVCVQSQTSTTTTTPKPVLVGNRWKGATTNLKQTYNWMSNTPFQPEGNTEWKAPKTTRFLGNPDGNNVVTSIPDSMTVEFGSTVTFDGNVKIVLGEGATISLNEANEGSEAVCTAGKPSKSTDFMCHENWVGVTKTGEEVPVTKPPCVAPQSNPEFPGDETYYVTMSLGVKQLTVGKFVFDGHDISTCKDLDVYQDQLQLVDCQQSIRFGNQQDLCISLNEINNAGCFCHSSCASLEDQALNEKETREAAEASSQAAKEQLQKLVTKEFQGTFTSSALGINDEVLQEIMSDPADKKMLQDGIVAALASRWNVNASAIVIEKFELQTDGQFAVVLKGTVTGEQIGFLNNVDANGNLQLDGFDMGTITAWDERDTTSLVASIRDALAKKIAEDQKMDGQADKDTAITECGSLCSGSDDLDELADAFFTIITDPVAGRNVLADDTSSLTPIKGKTVVDVTDAASALNNYLNSLSDDDRERANDFLDKYAPALAKLATSDSIQDMLSKLRTLTSPAFQIGQSMTLGDQSRLIDEINRGAFAQALASSIDGFLGMLNIAGSSFSFQLVSRSAPDRRRAASSHVIELTYSYDVLCAEAADDEDCDPLGVDVNVEATRVRLDLIAMLFPIQTHHECYSVKGGYDMACVQTFVDAAYKKVFKATKGDAVAKKAAAEQAALETFKSIVGCGFSGYNADGSCVTTQTVDEVQLTASGMLAANKAADNYAASSSGGSGGGFPVAAIAGAIGGLVVIIIIVVVVVVTRRNRGSRAGPATTSDRNVVAFENPMYDSPEAAQTTYQDTATSGGEGLYDEPAFNAGSTLDKANPMYQSAENLASGGAGGEESGYLDVAPDEADE